MSPIFTPMAEDSITNNVSNRNIEIRPHSGVPSTMTTPKTLKARTYSAKNRNLKSKYSSTEINKPEFFKRPNSNSSTKKGVDNKDSASTGDEERTRDVLFLRKMLVMNKKQEMLLNKRLARLLEEEEETQHFGDSSEKEKRLNTKLCCAKKEVQDKTDSANQLIANTIVDQGSEETLFEEEITEGKSPSEGKTDITFTTETLKKTAPVKQIQYDINGRRIYQYADFEDEDKKETYNKVKLNEIPTQKSYISEKCRKEPKRSTKTYKMEKSVTCTDQNSALKKPAFKGKIQVRKEDGDSQVSDCSVNPVDFKPSSKNSGCQGDGKGVQNVVVHCSTVVKNNSTLKKNVKVWNYEGLPRVRSDNNGKSISGGKIKLNPERTNNYKPIKTSNNNIQIEINNNPATGERGSKTVETVLLVRNKFSDEIE